MKDFTGLPVTVHSASALQHYDQALASLARFADPGAQLAAMLETESEFWMAHVFAAHLALWSSDRDDLPAAQQHLARLGALDAGLVNARERLHLGVLQAWVGGELHRASRLLDALLVRYPTDLLALLSGHQLDFFLGDAQNLRDRVSRVLSQWDSEHPMYGYLLGMLAFGQEESGHYAQAEQTGLAALARNPADIWGIHAVAHALEMQGEFVRGGQFLNDHQAIWSTDNGMVSHNAFHQALFQLEADDLEGALNTYDRYVHALNAAVLPPMVLLDGSGVLWRLFLDGHDVTARALRLASAWQAKTGQYFYAFNDAHAIMAYAAADELDTASALLRDLQGYVRQASDETSNLWMTRQVGLPVSEALVAFARENYAAACEHLLAVKNSTHQFGGSLAQRDAIARTLLEAAIRGGDAPLARAVLSERLVAHPASPYNHRQRERVASL